MFSFVAENPAWHLVVAAVLFFCILFGVCFGEQLVRGASYVVISPEEPVILMVYPRHFKNRVWVPPNDVVDDIFAKVLVLKVGGERVLIMSLDLCFTTCLPPGSVCGGSLGLREQR